MTPIRKQFRLDPVHLYMVFAALTYVIIFAQPQIAFVLHSFLLIWSYFLIVRKGVFFPVFTLIIYARSLVGFSAASSPFGYLEFNVLTNYLPALLFFISNREPIKPYTALKRYPWSYGYGMIAVIYSLVSGVIALEVLGSRLLPLFMFLLLLTKSFNFERLSHEFQILMRYLLCATFIVATLPGYTETVEQYLRGGIVFGEGSDLKQQLGHLTRGLGPFWDPRILGVMCAMFLAAALSSASTWNSRLNVSLALAGVIFSLSRGSIVLSALILFFALTSNMTRQKLIFLSVFLAFSLLISADVFYNLVKPLFYSTGTNPISQRSDFFQFAISKFIENPFGSGVGAMKNVDGLVVNGHQYFAVTDAYIAILLAEVGFVGFLVFLLSFREIFWGSNKISRAVFLGFFLLMLGSDLGDYGMFYLIIMVIGSYVARMQPLVEKHNSVLRRYL